MYMCQLLQKLSKIYKKFRQFMIAVPGSANSIFKLKFKVKLPNIDQSHFFGGNSSCQFAKFEFKLKWTGQ